MHLLGIASCTARHSSRTALPNVNVACALPWGWGGVGSIRGYSCISLHRHCIRGKQNLIATYVPCAMNTCSTTSQKEWYKYGINMA